MSINIDGISTRVLLALERDKCFVDKEISAIKLSRIVGTNTAYLSTVINTEFGCTFKMLINKYRVEMAQREIVKTGITSYETGERCGFTSRANYYEVFKNIVGMTPYQYLRYARAMQAQQKAKEKRRAERAERIAAAQRALGNSQRKDG